jgi:hypothetical protein
MMLEQTLVRGLTQAAYTADFGRLGNHCYTRKILCLSGGPHKGTRRKASSSAPNAAASCVPVAGTPAAGPSTEVPAHAPAATHDTSAPGGDTQPSETPAHDQPKKCLASYAHRAHCGEEWRVSTAWAACRGPTHLLAQVNWATSGTVSFIVLPSSPWHPKPGAAAWCCTMCMQSLAATAGC